MKKLIINRSKWGVGEEGGSLLNTKNKKYCCLGFYAKSVGFKNEHIKNIATPSVLVDYLGGESAVRNKRIKKLIQLLKIHKDIDQYEVDDNSICNKLMEVNDSSALLYINPIKREDQISQRPQRVT